MAKTLSEVRKQYGEQVDELEALAEAGGEAFTAKQAEVNATGELIKRMESTAALKAAAARPIDGQGNPTVPAAAKGVYVPGTNLSRAIVALAATKGIQSLAADWADKTWGADGAAVARALAVGSGSAGGFLVPEDFRSELIELLRPASVVMSFGPRILPMPNGNLTIPRVATGSTAEYVGENQNMAVTEPTFEDVNLVAKKLSALVPMSNDMLRYPTIAGDTFVRDDLVRGLAQRADLAMLRGLGGAYSPKGLLSYAQEIAASANYITANSTVTIANVTNDLAKLELALMNANVAMTKCGWIMSPRTYIYLSTLRNADSNLVFPEMAQGILRGKPFKHTTQVPNNIGGTSVGSEIYLVDWMEFIIGEGMTLEVKVQDGAAYFDGSSVVSGLSKDQTVVTALTAHDSAMRQKAAVAVLTDARWIP